MKPPGVVVCPSCGTKNRPEVGVLRLLRRVPQEGVRGRAEAKPDCGRTGGGVRAVPAFRGSRRSRASGCWWPRSWLRGDGSQPAVPDRALHVSRRLRGERPRHRLAATTERRAIASAGGQLSRGEALLASGDAAGALPLLAEAVGLLPEIARPTTSTPTRSGRRAARKRRSASTRGRSNSTRRIACTVPIWRRRLARSAGARRRSRSTRRSWAWIPRSPGALRDLAALYAQAATASAGWSC